MAVSLSILNQGDLNGSIDRHAHRTIGPHPSVRKGLGCLWNSAPRSSLPPISHDSRKHEGTRRLCAPPRGKSEPADIAHDLAQGRAPPDVFVSACRPVRIPLGSRFFLTESAHFSAWHQTW